MYAYAGGYFSHLTKTPSFSMFNGHPLPEVTKLKFTFWQTDKHTYICRHNEMNIHVVARRRYLHMDHKQNLHADRWVATRTVDKKWIKYICTHIHMRPLTAFTAFTPIRNGHFWYEWNRHTKF